jgi:hypothetical protein
MSNALSPFALPPSTLKTYLINLDFTKGPVTFASFDRYVRDSRDFLAVWYYIPLVWGVKSYLNSIDITHKLHQFLGNEVFFIVAEVNDKNINGILPKQAWDWFYRNHQVPEPPLLNFFDAFDPGKR